MLRANPDIQRFFDNLQVPGAGSSGARVATPVNALAAALMGNIVRPQIGGSQFQAPPINPRYRALPGEPPHQLPAPMGGTPSPLSGFSGGTPNLGGAAKAAGLEKLGEGAGKLIKGIADKLKADQAKQADLDAANAHGLQKSTPFGTTPTPATGRSAAPAAPGQAGPASSPFAPSPIGPASGAPAFTRPDSQVIPRGPVPPISGGGSLPYMAQGMPGAADKSASLNRSSAGLIDPQYDPRGLGAGLQPRFADLVQDTLQDAGDRGVNMIVTSGLRTPEQQAELYTHGRGGVPGPVVTNAPAGTSFHNWGAAADVNPRGREGTPADYATIGDAAKNLGLNWGGDFRSIKDLDHIQMPGSIADARAGYTGAPAATNVAGGFSPIAGRTSDLAPNRPTANFNPANLKYLGGSSGFAATHGATGADKGGFAIFPDAQTGMAAQRALWNTSRYSDVPLSQALKTWSGNGYTPQQLGFSPDQTFSGMSDADQQRLLDRQQQFEGWKPGSGGTQQAAQTPLPPSRPDQLASPQMGAAAYAATLPTSSGPNVTPQLTGQLPTQNTEPNRSVPLGPTAPNASPSETPIAPPAAPQFDPIGNRNPNGLPSLGGNPQGQIPTPYNGGPDLGPQLPQQPPLLNGGQPGVYSAPQIGPQGMNLPQPQMDPLALALMGGGDPNAAPLMAPGIVDLLNSAAMPAMPDFAMADFSMPDFNFGGMFNG
jgi:hypothetical protein